MAVVVRDLDRAVRLYRDGLGLHLEHIEDLPERGVRVAFFRAGGTRIEVVQPLRDDSEVSAFLARRGEGLHHLAFRPPDVERTVEASREAGATVVGDGGPGAGGTRVVFLHPKSTAGVLIELVAEGAGRARDVTEGPERG